VLPRDLELPDFAALVRQYEAMTSSETNPPST
jgi:hypothetical protein